MIADENLPVMKPENGIECSYRHITHVTNASLKAEPTSDVLRFQVSSKVQMYRAVITNVNVVVNVLQRQVTRVIVCVTLVQPLCTGKLSPSSIVVEREHAVDGISQCSWIPLYVIPPSTGGVPPSLHARELAVGYPRVVHTVKTSESPSIARD